MPKRSCILLAACFVLGFNLQTLAQNHVCTVVVEGSLCDGTTVHKEFVGEAGSEGESYDDAHEQADNWEEGNCMCSGEVCDLERREDGCQTVLHPEPWECELSAVYRGKKYLASDFGPDEATAENAALAELETLTGQTLPHTEVRIIGKKFERILWVAVARVIIATNVGDLPRSTFHAEFDMKGFGDTKSTAETNATSATRVTRFKNYLVNRYTQVSTLQASTAKVVFSRRMRPSDAPYRIVAIEATDETDNNNANTNKIIVGRASNTGRVSKEEVARADALAAKKSWGALKYKRFRR